MKEIKYTIFCVFVRTFVIPFYYGSGTVMNYGPGSDFLTSYGSGSASTRQKVTVPTVSAPVPQHCLLQTDPAPDPGSPKTYGSGSGTVGSNTPISKLRYLPGPRCGN
jgi:hypothetical protein